MTLDIKAMVVVFLYAVLSNFAIGSLALSDSSLACSNLRTQNFVYDYTTGNYTSDPVSQDAGINFFQVMLGMCQGLPWWLYWITQIPTILGVLYIIRAFIGFT